MRDFLYMHRINFAFQFLLIIIVILGYFFSPNNQYASSVTVHSLLASEIFSSNTAPLSRLYKPEDTIDLYLKELANKETRKEIFEEFVLNNNFPCAKELGKQPSVQFYEKRDNSFPVTGHFTIIKVKSSCKGFAKQYVEYLSSNLHKRLVDSIQRIENAYLDQLRRTIILNTESDLSDLETFLLNRKELLQKVIPLLKEEDNETILQSSGIHTLITQKNQSYKENIWGQQPVNLNMQIPFSRSAAQAELDFLSSITDLNQSTIGLISRNNRIDRYKTKHDFSDYKLVNISPAEKEISSTRSLYLAIFFIFIILGFGFVLMLLTKFKYHQKLQ